MKKQWMVIFIVSLCLLTTSLIALGSCFWEKNVNEANLEKYKNSTNSTGIEDLPKNPIDFEKLKKQNEDIYAWIKIDNTNVDYPILNPGDKGNSYYLHRGIDGQYDEGGVIYTEVQNSLDWSDPVTLVYGHNMRIIKTMFHEIHKYEDNEFFEKNRYFNIYAEGRILTYEVYSALDYDDRHIINSFNFKDKKVLKDFIDYTLNPISMNKNVREGVEVTEDDKIVILSTCTTRKDMRYLVIGVLRKDEKTQ